MWSRLQQAQIAAYKSDYKFWADYIVSNMDTITPLVSQYRMLAPDKLPRITQIQIAQHTFKLTNIGKTKEILTNLISRNFTTSS